MVDPENSPPRRGATWWAIVRLVVGLALIAGPLIMAWQRWAVLAAGNPITVVMGVVLALCGLLTVILAVARLLGRRNPRRSRLKTVAVSIVLIVGLLASAFLGWARPWPAEANAIAALGSGDRIEYREHVGWYEFVPTDPGGVGFVFYPGAKVDARAYAAMLRPLAERGVLVAVVAEPIGIALLPGTPDDAALSAHPEIETWALGGHSLGGVSAALKAQRDQEIDGLVFWGSFPAGRIRSDLAVLSVSGSEDGLSTPDNVEASRADLPPETQYVVIAGANHAAFGDYGPQSGDNPAVGDPATLRAEITDATYAFLADLG